ncbi:DNA polymerase III subunit beta [Mycoplasmoides pirum]|uniref:DNA polymerase III subunit beta n=1 Tax=Mycoplasmoides pirum TaxID=2122 RepID=UPI0004827C21|nr:DNA polymerase III subunit beta [Mycoplasmoides pirum]
MKITINRNVLIDCLKFSNNVILSGTNTSTNAVLNSIFFNVTEKELEMISSNGIISAKYTIKENIDIEETGKVLVKSKLLFGIISKIKDENVELISLDSSLQIKTKNYVSNINTIDSNSYPNLVFDNEGWDSIIIPSEKLSKAIKKVSHSALQQIERVNKLNGIYFDKETEDNILRIVATDSFKLSLYKIPFEGKKFKFLINTNVLNLISSFLKTKTDILFKIKDKNVMIETNEFVISCNMIDSEYPKIDPIIECKNETEIEIDRLQLIDALDRVISFSISDKSSICNIEITNNKLLVFYKSIELGSSKEEIDLLNFSGKPLEFAVNATFLLEHLKAFNNKNVCFQIEKNLKPFILYDKDEKEFIQVLVPMRSL